MSPVEIFLAPCLDNITVEVVVPVASNSTSSTTNSNLTNTSNSSTNTSNITNASNSTYASNTTITITITPTQNKTQNTTLNTTLTGNLTMDLTQFQLTSQTLVIASIVSLPLKAITSLRCAYLILDDVWLYDYSNRNFTGLIQMIFVTITNIQLVKF